MSDGRLPLVDSATWLAGGGEMGERIRALDWASTPLGPHGCLAPEPARRHQHNMHVPKPVDPTELAIVVANLAGRT
jgi:hypothetical protein